MIHKAKTDIAYDIIKERNQEVDFHFLWNEVARIINLSQNEYSEQISPFYTDLLLDARFITLGENVWDLREKHSFEKVHIDMNDIYTSIDDEIVELDEGLIAKADIEAELDDEDETRK